MIEIKNLSKSYNNGKTHAVDNISLTVAEGETLVLLGSSGCGKSTTLKMINRLITPTSGQILIDERENITYSLTELRRSVGYVFQGTGLFPHMTVAENVSIVLRLNKVPLAERNKRADELLQLVSLNPKKYRARYPDQLSGGEQQRVGVARALANKPAYLLMDEPFGALDAITRDSLQQEIIKLKRSFKKTIIFVTHDVFEALRLADRIAVMDQGRVLQIGSKDEIVKNPECEFVHQLFNKPFNQLKKYHE